MYDQLCIFSHCIFLTVVYSLHTPQPQEIALAQQLKGTVLPHIPKPKKEKARGISKRQKQYSCFNALRRVSLCCISCVVCFI